MSIKLSMAPIAWTNDDLPQLGGNTPVTTYLEEIKQAGFFATEIGGKFPYDKQALKTLINQHGVKISSGWFSGNLLPRTVEEEIVDLNKEIDRRLFVECEFIIYAECSNTIQGDDKKSLSEKPVLTDKEMQSYAEKYSKLKAHAESRGINLVYHHHMGTIIETEAEMDAFLKYTTPDVQLLFDTGHCLFGGGNPVAYMQKNFDRIGLIHLKDVRLKVTDMIKSEGKSFLDAVLSGAFTMPGDGDIDFDPIIKIIKENNYNNYLVIEAEQDPAIANPLTYAQNSKAYLDGLFAKYDIEVIKP